MVVTAGAKADVPSEHRAGKRDVIRFTRRNFVNSVGAAVAVPGASMLVNPAVAASVGERPAPAKAASPEVESVYLFFNAAEARFIESACERLIPAHESGPGALGAGVPNYLDKQLGGAWGAAAMILRESSRMTVRPEFHP